MRKGLLFGEKKAAIRKSGMRTEKKFFGKSGVFARAGHTKHLKNAKGDYTGALKLPTYIDRAVARVLYEGSKGLNWEWDRLMTKENKLHFEKFLVSVHHPLAYEAGTAEWRYKRFILDYVMPYIEKNPGRQHGKFRSCVKQVSRKRLPPGSDPKKICGAAMRKNPPHEVHAKVAGILYNRCLEIRAEKTTAKGLKGLYYHPFLERSQVCILALDNGDLLIHSKVGESLWKPI